MNQKAQRAEIEFPLLLNLQSDRPRVASDFRSVEKLNAPYINGMIQPLWEKVNEIESKPVYDYKNNRYEVKDGYLTKNGEELFAVNNEHFERTDVTDEFKDYLAFDFTDDGTIAKLEWDTKTNSVTLTFGNLNIVHPNLFTNGVILTSRVRVIGNTAIGVVVYKENSTLKMLYINNTTNKNDVYEITWCTTQPKTSSGDPFTVTSINIPNPSPIINIANPLTNVYAVSLVSNYGEVLFTRKEGYFTFVDNNGTIIKGTDWVAANGSATETIRNYNITNFLFSNKKSYIAGAAVYCYYRDGKWYYANEPYTTEVPDTDVSGFQPTIIPNQTITYEGGTYNVYLAYIYTNTISFTASVDKLYSKVCSVKVKFSDGDTEYTDTFTGDNSSVTIEHTFDSWFNNKLTVTSIIITYDGVEYTDVKNAEYTIVTETTPTTVNAPYITAPNVFLDNGNMYTWYTIPSANESASGYALTLPENCFIVESAKLSAISGNNYTFDIIEAHLVNSLTKYARENSIAVGQNFWNSSFKMNSDGVRTPYQIYVSKEAVETISATVKYTEYSNSNCSDMLYYTGTVPNSKQKFYKYATNNSQDVAWFNPGGFRATLKGHWNMLYLTDASGAVAIQGLSYSESENKMGTLITPFASVSDVNYIAASSNFIVYCDTHNKWYKIEIKEGAELRSVFDNHYVIVNTTSYWNMWDEAEDRKYHYATDYNNRVKLGMTRPVYRSCISTYYTESDRRKYATAINPNYNMLPRLSVSSMIPTLSELSYIIDEIEAPKNIHSYNSQAEEAREVQAIEVYLQGTSSTDTAADYIASIKSYTDGDYVYRDPNLVDVSLSATKSIIFITDIFTTFINGAGNNDFAVEGVAKYPLVYNNQDKPIFLYSAVSGLDVEDAKWFFIIQGQYYAVIGEKLYAMIYSGGTITQSDAIVDIRDMKFVGNTPAIAFFINPYTKQVYSFTGDANMQQLFDSSRFTYKLSDDNINHWYDESCQAIYVATEQGLLVFSNQNTYCLEAFKDVYDMEFVDGNIHIIESDKETTLRYYHDREGFEPHTIDLETSFYGLGAEEVTSIDRWQIVLFDPEHKEQEVEVSVRSLTDITTVSETKKMKIDKSAWDKWSHSVLVNYNPKLIKGKGIRLSVKTNATIQSITPHITDNRTSQSSNNKFSV